jgi:hypothetical protein
MMNISIEQSTECILFSIHCSGNSYLTVPRSLFAQFQITSSIFTGGTFALYSLLCRHAKVSTIPNQHKTDEELTTYSRQTYEENSLAAKVKRWLEGHAYKKNCLLILVLIGTCTAIGDGILTPAISGIKRQFFFVSNTTGTWIITFMFVFCSSLCDWWNKSSEANYEHR